MPRKKKVESKPEYSVFIHYEERTTGGERLDSEDRWSSRADEHTEWELTGATLEPGDDWNREEVVLEQEVHTGDPIWVVYVRYQTGGTFGTRYGAGAIVKAFLSLEEAQQCAESITQGTYKGYKCWEGYFERLEYVIVEELTISRTAKRFVYTKRF